MKWVQVLKWTELFITVTTFFVQNCNLISNIYTDMYVIMWTRLSFYIEMFLTFPRETREGKKKKKNKKTGK